LLDMPKAARTSGSHADWPNAIGVRHEIAVVVMDGLTWLQDATTEELPEMTAMSWTLPRRRARRRSR
jgi:hypothetical protein